MLKRSVAAVLLTFSLTASAISAYAIEQRIELTGNLWEHEKGEAIINDAAQGQKEITINASGLEPNSVYTLWLVTETSDIGQVAMGAGDLTFKSDAQGNLNSTATVPVVEISDWDTLRVVHHPTGDPKDLENSEVALEGDLSGGLK
ncbi:MAG: hypothetical protein HYS21_11510 [Deltaproteobacteria bacterium]|nr:hypothetical protein [Deltaproteobacteria bacterium]